MRIIFLISVLLLCVLIELNAQSNKVSVSGYVKDADSGETLSGATIYDENGQAVIANPYGHYSITIKKGSAALNFKYIGYTSKIVTMDISADTVLNISLSPAIQNIEEVVVQAPSVPIVNLRDLGNVSVNMQQLKYVPLFLGEQDIFKYLHLLPGVSAGKEGSSGLNIRGGSSDQSLILLDDVPIYNQAHAFGFVSVFSGEAIKSADLYKTYSSPMYGSRLSGIASFRMRDGNRYEHRQSLVIGTLTASITAEGPVKQAKGSYMISARRFVPDLLLRGVYAVTNDNNTTRPLFSFYDISGKFNYDIGNRNTIYLSIYSGQDKLHVTNTETRKEYDEEGTPTKIKTKSRGGFGWGNTVASIRLNTILSPKAFMNNTLYFSHLENNKKTYHKDYLGKSKAHSEIRSIMDELGLKSTVEHKISTNYDLSYGVNAALQFFKPQNTSYKRDGHTIRKNYDNRKLGSLSLFLNNNFNIGVFNFNVGLRAAAYDNQTITVYEFEPRFSASVSLPNNLSCWFSYARNTQPLFSMGKYYYAMPIDYWIPFTDKKLPTSDQLSIGVKKSFSSSFSFSAEAYYKKMKNLSLVYDSDDFLLGEGGYDTASGTAFGIESMIQYQRNRLGITASYSWSESKRKIHDQIFPFMFDTPHELNIFGMYDILKRTGRKHTISINVNYKTGLPYILSNESYPALSANAWYDEVSYIPRYPNVRLNNFFRTDISYNMERVMKNGVRNWQISILNITNHKNPYVVYKDKARYKALTLIPIMPSFSYKRTF